MPYCQIKLRGNEKTFQKGSVFDITVRHRGTFKFVGRIMEIIEGKLMKCDYFEGDFLGNAEWTLDPLDQRTRVRFQLDTKSNRFLITLISPFFNVVRSHSEVMQLEFEGLNKHACLFLN